MDFSLGAAAVLNGISTTWANRPAANSVPIGTRITVTNLGNRQFYSNGTLWLPAGSPVIAQSGVASSVTGTTTETTLASITIPGGMMGPNGKVRVRGHASCTSNANSKIVLVRFAGASPGEFVATNSSYTGVSAGFQNRTVSSQLLMNEATVGGTGYGGTASINTALDQVLTISALLANAADSVTLEAYTVEVLPA